MQQDFDKIQQKSLRAVTVSDVVDAAGRETRKGQADDEWLNDIPLSYKK
jgi:hypothetical protein